MMLGFIFRGVFLIGILTWYSTHVWKLIDTYFKDQFRSYLEEEYRRNPRMRTDLKAHLADKANPSVIPSTVAPPLERLLEACQEDICPVDKAGNDKEVPPTTTENQTVTGSPSQNQTDWTIDKVGVQVAEEGGTSNETEEEVQVAEVTTRREFEEVPVETTEEKEERPSESTSTTTEAPRKRLKQAKRSPVVTEAPRKPRKRKVKTLLFTEEDFASAKREEGDDDFWEFEEDGGGKDHVTGVLVSQLPLKPRLQLGELDRVDPDEFCSLGLEEDDCDRTYKWP